MRCETHHAYTVLASKSVFLFLGVHLLGSSECPPRLLPDPNARMVPLTWCWASPLAHVACTVRAPASHASPDTPQRAGAGAARALNRT